MSSTWKAQLYTLLVLASAPRLLAQEETIKALPLPSKSDIEADPVAQAQEQLEGYQIRPQNDLTEVRLNQAISKDKEDEQLDTPEPKSSKVISMCDKKQDNSELNCRDGDQEKKTNEEETAVKQQDEPVMTQWIPKTFDNLWKLSVAPGKIQLFDTEGHERAQSVKRIIEEELPNLELWHTNFARNLDQLFTATPFYKQKDGFFEQEFYGEWSASDSYPDVENVVAMHEYVNIGSIDQSEGSEQTWSEKFSQIVQSEASEIFEGAKNFANNAFQNDADAISSVDPKSIHHEFGDFYGWAKLNYEVQLYDIDFGELTRMKQAVVKRNQEQDIANEAIQLQNMKNDEYLRLNQLQEDTNVKNLEEPEQSGQGEVKRDDSQTDELESDEQDSSSIKSVIEEQDKEVKEINLSEIKRQKVYVQDLLTKTEQFNSNTLIAELRVKVKVYEKDYIDHSAEFEYRTLFGSIFHEDLVLDEDLAQIQLSQDVQIMDEEKRKRPCNLQTFLSIQAADAKDDERDYQFRLPRVMSDWGEKINDDYAEEGSQFIGGKGTDQDLTENQRLYFVNIAILNTSSSNEDQNEEECFPNQIQGLFLNKRKNVWMTRFMSYGIIYLLVSGLSTVTSVYQYRSIKKNWFKGRAASSNINPMPPIILTAWTFQSFIFHLVTSCGMLFVDLASQVCPMMAIVGVLIAFSAITYKAAATQQREMLLSDLFVYVTLITFALILFNPRIMTRNLDTILVFGFLWFPQIISNLFTHPNWQFHYGGGFTLIQSCYYIFAPLYARGFHNNFYFLKPDPFPVRMLLGLYAFQFFIMQMQKHFFDWTLCLKCTHSSDCAKYCMTRKCRVGLRKYFLNKLRKQHEWGWNLALNKITSQQNAEKAEKELQEKDNLAQAALPPQEQRNQQPSRQNNGRASNNGQGERNVDHAANNVAQQPFSNAAANSDAAVQRRSIGNEDAAGRTSQLSQQRPQRNSDHLEIPPAFDVLGDPLESEELYPESLQHLKYKFYLYFRSFKRSMKPLSKRNSFAKGIQHISVDGGTIDSPRANETDCSICQGCLKFKPQEQGQDERHPKRCSGYYETPCLHVYHRECLLAWLNIKLECPQCRETLPKPFEYDAATASLFSDEEIDESQAQDQRRVAGLLISGNPTEHSQAPGSIGQEVNPIGRIEIEIPEILQTRAQQLVDHQNEIMSDYEHQRSVIDMSIPFQVSAEEDDDVGRNHFQGQDSLTERHFNTMTMTPSRSQAQNTI